MRDVEEALEQRDEVGRGDVGTDRARVLGSLEENRERIMQLIAQWPGHRDCIGGISFRRSLSAEPGEEVEEGNARISLGGAPLRVSDEAGYPVGDHRLEQRLLGREVPVDGPGTDAGPGGDLVERHVEPGFAENLLRCPQDPVPVAARVRAQRPVSGHC